MYQRIKKPCTLAVFSLFSFVAYAAGEHSIPTVLDLDASVLVSSNGEAFGGSVLVENSEENGAVLRIVPPPTGENETRARLANHTSIQGGHHYRLEYAMRATKVDAGSSGQVGIQLTIGALPALGDKIDRASIELQSLSVVGEEWELFSYDWSPKRRYAPGELWVELSPAYFREPLEIKGIKMLDFGSSPPAERADQGERYPGQKADAPWRSAADARIREYRMAPLTIEVADPWGTPLQDVRVEVKMIEHAYLFGTCVKAVRLVDAPIQVDRDDFDEDAYLKDNAIYREKLRELFNFAVFENDMKWPSWAGERSDRGRSQAVTMDAIEWLRRHGMKIKGHTMLWASWRRSPEFLREKADDPIMVERAIQNHLIDQGMAFRGKLEYIDVLNEALSHNDMIERVGWDKVSGWFKTAKDALPETRLVINEFDILGNGGHARRQADHLALLERLLDEEAPIDVIGFQSHFWSTRLTPPERLYETIDRFASFDLPLMVSEFDMNILDEQLQADYSRDFYKVWFSHPATEAFIMWGFWSEAHWFGEPGAMFRKDWSPKPNLKAYTDLVFGEWWTEETLRTGADGGAALRAFKGDYEITLSAPGHATATRRISVHEPTRLFVVLHPNPTPLEADGP